MSVFFVRLDTISKGENVREINCLLGDFVNKYRSLFI